MNLPNNKWLYFLILCLVTIILGGLAFLLGLQFTNFNIILFIPVIIGILIVLNFSANFYVRLLNPGYEKLPEKEKKRAFWWMSLDIPLNVADKKVKNVQIVILGVSILVASLILAIIFILPNGNSPIWVAIPAIVGIVLIAKGYN